MNYYVVFREGKPVYICTNEQRACKQLENLKSCLYLFYSHYNPYYSREEYERDIPWEVKEVYGDDPCHVPQSPG